MPNAVRVNSVKVAVTPSAGSATGFREAAEYTNTVLAVNRESSTLRGYRTALSHLKKFEDSHDVSTLHMDPEFAKLAFSRLALARRALDERTVRNPHHCVSLA